MRCFDKLNMTVGWYEMFRQAQHDSGGGMRCFDRLNMTAGGGMRPFDRLRVTRERQDF